MCKTYSECHSGTHGLALLLSRCTQIFNTFWQVLFELWSSSCTPYYRQNWFERVTKKYIKNTNMTKKTFSSVFYFILLHKLSNKYRKLQLFIVILKNVSEDCYLPLIIMKKMCHPTFASNKRFWPTLRLFIPITKNTKLIFSVFHLFGPLYHLSVK